MDEITNLLVQPESSTLEFKQAWYKIDSENPKTAERQKGEMIKDILSLANGNVITAGKTGYLVIGVGDKIQDDGQREILGVDKQVVERVDAERLLKIINSVCHPTLSHLLVFPVGLRGKTILVIKVLPSPHVYETTREIKTPKRTYSEYTVFVRHGESVRIASTDERLALRQLKQLRFKESERMPAWVIGSTVGGLLGYALIPKALDSLPDDLQMSKTVEALTGFGTGFLIGGLLGQNLQDVRNLLHDVRFFVTRKRFPVRLIYSLYAACQVVQAGAV